MLNKPINNIVKTHFNNIYSQAKEKAEKDYNLNIASKTKGLNHFDTLKLHIKEQNRLEEIIEKNTYPYYVKNHSSENWLLTQFASRYFLLGVDESKEFIEAVYLGEYRGKIYNFIHESEKEIPKYTFKQFLKGKKCKYYFEFERTYNIDREDYYNILEWQSNNLIDIVAFDTSLIISKYQEYLKTLENPIEYINKQFSFIEDELVPNIKSAEKLKKILSKLYAFENLNFSEFDNNLLLSNYELFHGDKVDFKRITPKSIGAVIGKLKKEPNDIVGNEYTLFYAIENVSFWLEDIINGKSFKEPFRFPIWEDVLEEALNKGKIEAEKIDEQLTEFAYHSDNSNEEIKKHLINKFEEYRIAFNNYEPKQVFALIDDKNKVALASSFKVNCFFNNDSQKYKDDLSEAVKIEAVLWAIVGIYCAVFDTHKMEVTDDKSSSVDVMFLLHQMVLDKEIYNELDESLSNFMQYTTSLSIPFIVHFENQREKFAWLFHRGISRLQEVLDDAEPTHKVLYLQSRLKELKQRELSFSRFSKLEYSKEDELKYPNLLKEFLDVEADFIKETNVIDDVMMIAEAQPKLLPSKKTEALQKPNRAEELTEILDKMKAKAEEEKQKKIKDNLSELLDNLRGQQISSLQLYKIVKENTNLEKDALGYLKEDIGWYLFSMKMAQDCFYSQEEVDFAFNKVKKKGYSEEKLFELGYLKNTKTFFDVEYEDPEEPVYIDKEKLLYPNEFNSIKELLKIINKELSKLELKTAKSGKPANSLDDIIDTNKQEYISKLLEDLSITKNRESILSLRKKGALRGVVEALRDNNILPHLGIDKLCKLIAGSIGLELKSKLDFSDTSQKFQKDAKQYIKKNPFH